MRTIPGLSIDTKVLQDRLAKCAVGELVSYRELSDLISRDVQNGARSNLTTAVRRLLAEGKVYAAVRNAGIKRLDDHEIVGIGPEVIAKMRRASRRAQVKLASVEDFNALSRDEKTTHNMALSVLGVVAYMTKPATVRQLETRIEQAQAALPLQKTLDALKGE